MLIGPNGEKRPVDAVANTARVMEVATGETDETYVARPGKGAGRRAARRGPRSSPRSASGRSRNRPPQPVGRAASDPFPRISFCRSKRCP